jgi:glutamate dehydrogenase/leucine dehydrogenase
VFVPDYLANAGGVIDFHQETINDQPDAVLAAVARIGAISCDVLRRAAATGATPLSVADGIVQARIRRAKQRPPLPATIGRRLETIGTPA